MLLGAQCSGDPGRGIQFRRVALTVGHQTGHSTLESSHAAPAPAPSPNPVRRTAAPPHVGERSSHLPAHIAPQILVQLDLEAHRQMVLQQPVRKGCTRRRTDRRLGENSTVHRPARIPVPQASPGSTRSPRGRRSRTSRDPSPPAAAAPRTGCAYLLARARRLHIHHFHHARIPRRSAPWRRPLVSSETRRPASHRAVSNGRQLFCASGSPAGHTRKGCRSRGPV